MRVTGGEFGGRSLRGPSSEAVRPTSDKLRQAIFNILAHGYGDPVPQARVLDLFAGTGALGIEALSRGAAYTLFVEEAASSRAIIRDNLEALQLTGVTRIFRRDATRLGPRSIYDAFSLVFCDPPYGKGLAERAVASLKSGNWLRNDALLVIEEAADAKFAAPAGFLELERRSYDDTELIFLRS